MINLISVQDLRENSSISDNISAEIIEPYISSSQQMHVNSLLGSSLLRELQYQITGNTLTELNTTLLTEYVRPVCVWATMLEASPFIHWKTTTFGIVTQQSDTSTSATDIGFTTYRQAIKDQLTFHSETLKKYLFDNSASYPLYRPTAKQTNYSNGIYLGKY